MTTIHDEEKIKELIEKSDPILTYFYPPKQKISVDNAMKAYAEHIRQKTIDECIACVPDARDVRLEIGDGEIIDVYINTEAGPFNDCREKSIINMEQLKK